MQERTDGLSVMQAGKREWGRVMHGILEIGLVLTALVSLATVFDQWHRLLELFSHFRLQYLIVAILLTAAFLWLRWGGHVALGVATIALNAWFVVPWYLPVERGAAADTDIRLLNANVLASNGNYEKLKRLVQDTDPDILIVQEITPAWIESLQSLKARYPYSVTEPRDDPFGIALFSKLPLEATAVIHAEPRGYPQIQAAVISGGERLQLIGAHTANPIGNGGYWARNLHLDGIAALAARTPAPLVVAGDLNISIWSNHYRRLVRDTGLRNAREGFGVEPTWPVFFPPAMIPIDHFLVSGDIEVTSYQTGPDIGSDHLPVAVTLRVSR